MVPLQPDESRIGIFCYIFCLPWHSIQYQDYFFVSLAVSWVYDCFLTLDREISSIHSSPWKIGSILYVMTRYMPAFVLCIHLCMNYLPNENIVTCKLLHSIWFLAAALCIAGAEGIFVLRTYALWGNKKFILSIMLSTVLCFAILDVIMTMTISRRLDLHLSDIGDGCYSLSRDTMSAYPWTLLVAFELEIIALTMIRVYREYRRGCPLLEILLQHNIFYFGTGIALSVVNIVVIECLSYTSSNMFGTFQIVMHTILVTRMHLQFCSTNQVYEPSESGTTPLSRLTHVELQTCSHSNV